MEPFIKILHYYDAMKSHIQNHTFKGDNHKNMNSYTSYILGLVQQLQDDMLTVQVFCIFHTFKGVIQLDTPPFTPSKSPDTAIISSGIYIGPCIAM